MNPSRVLSFASLALLAGSAAACSAKSPGPGPDSPSGSEVAVSAVSGAVNNTGGSSVAWMPAMPKRTPVQRVLDAINPVSTAYAADWSCVSGSLSPSFDGAGSYEYTPPSCKVTWAGGHGGSSSWSGPFNLVYGASCSGSHAWMGSQVAGCELTRTTSAGGDTRTVTGFDGYERQVTHDTNGAGTGWDSSVSPAPTDDGVVSTCGSGGCASSRDIVINGSHITGVASMDGDTYRIWDHTVTSQGITVSDQGGSLVVSGTVVVQHNLIKVTSTTTFDGITYGEPLCCFPTAGSVSTTFSRGPDVGKTESLAFSSACGEATLTKADGRTEAITLQHCL
jgi:hypothetical protein